MIFKLFDTDGIPEIIFGKKFGFESIRNYKELTILSHDYYINPKYLNI